MILWSTPGGLSLLSDLVFFPIRLISAPEIDLPLGDKGRLERLQKKPSFVSRVPQLRIICQHILLSTTLPVLVHSSLSQSQYPSDKSETLPDRKSSTYHLLCCGGRLRSLTSRLEAMDIFSTHEHAVQSKPSLVGHQKLEHVPIMYATP